MSSLGSPEQPRAAPTPDGQPFHYGGQAVLEGVMMRGENSVAVAVRRPSGGIALHEEPLRGLSRHRLMRLPLLRGIGVLGEMLVLGMRALIYSTNVALEEEGQEIKGGAVWLTIGLALLFAVALFFVLPLLLVGLADSLLPSSLWSNVAEGLVRLAIFVAYLWLIGRVPNIQRVFACHGAEHKTINALEAGEPLEPARVRPYSRAHTRCGTGFLLVVMVVSIFVFALLGDPVLWLRVTSRVVLIPVIAALSYELVRFSANHHHRRLVRWSFAPGLALQALTTREPTDAQVEVAIAAIERVLATDGRLPQRRQATEEDLPPPPS